MCPCKFLWMYQRKLTYVGMFEVSTLGTLTLVSKRGKGLEHAYENMRLQT
jgi:hypothetical protein